MRHKWKVGVLLGFAVVVTLLAGVSYSSSNSAGFIKVSTPTDEDYKLLAFEDDTYVACYEETDGTPELRIRSQATRIRVKIDVGDSTGMGTCSGGTLPSGLYDIRYSDEDSYACHNGTVLDTLQVDQWGVGSWVSEVDIASDEPTVYLCVELSGEGLYVDLPVV